MAMKRCGRKCAFAAGILGSAGYLAWSSFPYFRLDPGYIEQYGCLGSPTPYLLALLGSAAAGVCAERMSRIEFWMARDARWTYPAMAISTLIAISSWRGTWPLLSGCANCGQYHFQEDVLTRTICVWSWPDAAVAALTGFVPPVLGFLLRPDPRGES